MENNPSKFEEFITLVAEWKARFLQEREWRESVQEEKKELQEKYEQIVFELGTQKKQIEQLEERIMLLSSGDDDQQEDSGNVSKAFVQEDLYSENINKEANPEEEIANNVIKELEKNSFTHHIYTNPVVYESQFYPGAHFTGVVLDESPSPHILHRYDPELFNEENMGEVLDID